MDYCDKLKNENAIMASNIISSLIESIEKKVKSKEKQPKECAELKTLKERCCDSNIAIASTAFQGITKLVEKKVLLPSQTMSVLISLLPSVNHYTPLISTIGNILLLDLKEQLRTDGNYECQYNFTSRRHPFITILKHDSAKSWNALYNCIQIILSKYESINFVHRMNMLRVVFLYVFCHDSDNFSSCKTQLFSLLLKQPYQPKIKTQIVQLLAWQRIDINYCWLVQKLLNNLLHSDFEDDRLIIGAFTPCLALVIKWLILNGYNPVLWLDLLSESLEINADGVNAVLYILSDVIMQTPASIIYDLVNLCKYTISSCKCNKFIVHKFAAAILIWMVKPSFLSMPVLKTMEFIIKYLITESKEWSMKDCTLDFNPYYNIMKYTNKEIMLSVEMSKLCESWSKDKKALLKWLKNLHSCNSLIMQRTLQPIISSIFLCENDEEVIEISSEILLNVSNSYNSFSFLQLCLTFFKLSRETKPKNQLKFLLILIKLARSKENVPLIIGIIETLKNNMTHSQLMLPFTIDLYVRLWKIDNRTYPHLHKALFNSPNSKKNSWEISVMKTIALRDICQLAPELYGKSLVPKLSEILNDCDNYASGTPSAIAIEAVIELCKAQVTDITGTWKALRQKLSCDKRPEVQISLCKLFGEIPTLKPPGSDRKGLIDDIIPRLWDYAMSKDSNVSKAALKSLAKFSPESYDLKLVPDCLKNNVQIPRQYTQSAVNITRKQILDELQYVPGECFTEFLCKVDQRAAREVGDMLISLIEEELNSLPRRFFTQAEEMLEPSNYSHLPHSSICRALIDHIKKFIQISKIEEKIIPTSVIESLRVLSFRYSKCLPPLNWLFIENLKLNDDCTAYCVNIVAKQATSSKTARKILEDYVKTNIEQVNQVGNLVSLYPSLPFVCSSLGANTLRQFLEKSIKFSCNASLNSGSDYFEKFLINVKETLESKVVPEPRKALLVSQMQCVLGSIPPEHKIMNSYAQFAIILPPKSIEFVSSPASWSEITSVKLRRSVHIRAAIALRPESLNPLVWFNECIDAVITLPDEQNLVLRNVLKVLQKKRNVYHGNWIEELMWRTQASTSSTNTSESIRVTLFFLDMFVCSIVTLSGYDCFFNDISDEVERRKVLDFFPIALFDLLQLPDWISLTPKVMEWIHSLSEWKSIPRIYSGVLDHAVLIMRNDSYCRERDKWLRLFYLSLVNFAL